MPEDDIATRNMGDDHAPTHDSDILSRLVVDDPADLASVSSIRDQFEQWRAQKYRNPSLDTLYLFSPEWADSWEQMWHEYDKLEQARQTTTLEQLPWQMDLKDFREQTNAKYKAEYQPMSHELWILAPLSIHLDRYLLAASNNRSTFSWRAALDNWTRFRSIVAERSDFLNTLSPPQRSSFEVLDDWWKASYSDPSILHETQAYMESVATTPCLKSPLLTWNQEILVALPLNRSLYHSSCFQLFCAEFHPQCWEPYHIVTMNLNLLQFYRRRAVSQSICQRMGYSVLFPDLEQGSVKPYPKPVRLANGWFDGMKFTDYPYYLWDCNEKKTVRVDDLPSCPEYVCISHTWGRWRKETSVLIPGVEWAVPENTRYDVHTLPDILKELGSRYVWFDLFCIPQEYGDERQAIEISRQASIFRNSQKCIAWLNNCASFEGVDAALKWLAVYYLKATSTKFDSDWIDSRLKDLEAGADSTVEFMEMPERYASLPTALLQRHRVLEEHVGWFSSLWTLQEAVLCPDLELCSMNWDRLVDANGIPISLTTLLIFLQETLKVEDELPVDAISNPHIYQQTVADRQLSEERSAMKYPSGVESLQRFSDGTELGSVLADLSPMSVLTNANERQYTGERAPGVMSAVGITDWYHTRNTDPTAQQLVLGVFPLSFLREAARKIGAIFFESRRESPGYDSGTMLPFSAETGHNARPGTYSSMLIVDRKDHDAVSSWIIHADGSVEIPSAGIVASSESQEPVKGFIIGTTTGRSELFEDLVLYLRELSAREEEQCVYAVALYEDCRYQSGILLRVLDNGDHSGHKKLAKIGTYMIRGIPLPEASATRWIVV